MIINGLNLKKNCDHNKLHIKRMLAKKKKNIYIYIYIYIKSLILDNSKLNDKIKK